MRLFQFTTTALAAALAATVAMPAHAGDGVGTVMGAGQWTCAKALEVEASGTDIDNGLLVGWLLGYWSAVTFERDAPFNATVKEFGGRAIYDATMSQCRNALPEVQLYMLTQAIIENTK